MFRRRIRFAWKILPARVRMAIIRATQEKFTVSAAAVIMNDSGEVLLLNHVLRPYSGWGLPGGFLAAREQPEAAIRREIREETGIELTDLEMFRIRTIDRHVEMMFSAKTSDSGEVLSQEIFELRWFDVAELPEDLPESQKVLIREKMGAER